MHLSAAASQSYGLAVQVGYTAKLFRTAAGACLLSDITDQEQRRKVISNFASTQEMKKFQDFDAEIQDCQNNGYLGLPSSETKSVVELSAPVCHLTSKVNVGVITILYFATEILDSRKHDVIDELLKSVQQLQQKITIIMPNPIK